MRGQKEEEKKTGMEREKLKQKKAVMIAWKLLDQVSSWTSFSFSLPLKPPHPTC